MRKFEQIDWTDERKAKLRELIDKGLTGQEIANEMGLTKGQIMGAIFRAQLQLKGTRKPKLSPAEDTSEPPSPKKPRYGKVHLLELADSQCHFINGSGPASASYCGRPAVNLGRPYCEEHWARMYQPLRSHR